VSSSVADATATAPVEHAALADVRRSYADQAAAVSSIYVVGAVTAFIAAALALSGTEAGLHSSATATGMVVAGLGGDRLDRLAGVRLTHLAALGLLGLAMIMLAGAPALVATLAAAGAIGFGAGVMLGHVNQTLSAGGGVRARVQIARAALTGKTLQLTVPIAIAAGVALGVGWQFAVLPMLVLVGYLFLATRRVIEGPSARVVAAGRLPRSYWLPWAFVALAIGMEYAVIFWGSTLVAQRTGVSLADATLAISAFIAGPLVGRILLSTHALSRLDPVRLMRGGTVLMLVAVLLLWLTTSYEISVLGMFLGGLGVGVLYPLGAAVALAAAPGQPAAASARLVLAAGLALLVAPLSLGILVDFLDVTAAWLMIPALCVVSLLLTVPVARVYRVVVRT